MRLEGLQGDVLHVNEPSFFLCNATGVELHEGVELLEDPTERDFVLGLLLACAENGLSTSSKDLAGSRYLYEVMRSSRHDFI